MELIKSNSQKKGNKRKSRWSHLDWSIYQEGSAVQVVRFWLLQLHSCVLQFWHWFFCLRKCTWQTGKPISNDVATLLATWLALSFVLCLAELLIHHGFLWRVNVHAPGFSLVELVKWSYVMFLCLASYAVQWNAGWLSPLAFPVLKSEWKFTNLDPRIKGTSGFFLYRLYKNVFIQVLLRLA
jgi:hypothetical protein